MVQRGGIVVAVAAVVGGFVPAAANASRLWVEVRHQVSDSCRYDVHNCRYDALFYEAAPGERNDVDIALERRQGWPVAVIRDRGAAIEVGPACTSRGPHEAECSSDIGRLGPFELSAGDLHDSLAIMDPGPGAGLRGGSGDDRLVGGRGWDTLDGGPGQDVIDGNEGSDRITYAGRKAGVRVDLSDPTVSAGTAHERDHIANVESVQGGNGPDLIVGSLARNTLQGGAGDDRISGGAAYDDMHGGRGNDRLRGNDGGNFIDGGAGADLIVGGCGHDTLHGRAGPDRFYAVDGLRDKVFGWGGRDFAEVELDDGLGEVEVVRLRSRPTVPCD